MKKRCRTLQIRLDESEISAGTTRYTSIKKIIPGIGEARIERDFVQICNSVNFLDFVASHLVLRQPIAVFPPGCLYTGFVMKPFASCEGGSLVMKGKKNRLICRPTLRKMCNIH